MNASDLIIRIHSRMIALAFCLCIGMISNAQVVHDNVLYWNYSFVITLPKLPKSVKVLLIPL